MTDSSEEWSVLSPHLESQEAGEDGLTLKRMIAAGAGIPLHFLAEPESATRTTAEAAGGPTYRRLEQRQRYFCWLVADVARAALGRWAAVRGTQVDGAVSAEGTDLSARDNVSLANAAAERSGCCCRWPVLERGADRAAEWNKDKNVSTWQAASD